MGTKENKEQMEIKEKVLEKAHDYCFENYSGLQNNLDHIKEQGFLDGVEWLYEQSTPQKETIERLREALQNVTSSLVAHIGSERANEWLEVKQAEQLLNTTEQ